MCEAYDTGRGLRFLQFPHFHLDALYNSQCYMILAVEMHA